MKDIFSSTGLQVLEALSFTKTLFAFDFDGTLARIVSVPEAAHATSETEALLNKLNDLVSVAVISGRSVADLRTRIRIDSDLLIGNHGLEGLNVKTESIEKAEVLCRDWTNQLKKSWAPLKHDKGVFIENKKYSLALHYRRSRNKQQARLNLFSLISKLQPSPRVILGKCVMNLVPTGGPHKGVALLETMMALDFKCAFYIGDDDTDEDVFSLPDSRIISVRVGRKNSSQAQFFIKRQNEMNRLLRKLIKLNQTSPRVKNGK